MPGFCPAHYRFGAILASISLLVAATPVGALVTNGSYYDWGPYYQSQQVLGLSFSSLEHLPTPTLPAEVSIPPATGIFPGNPLSPFEHFIENTQLTFTFDPVAKEELRLSIAEERLSEAKTLTDQGQHQYAAEAAVAYRQTMRTVSENLQTLATTNPDAAATLSTVVENAAVAHAVVAESIVLASPPAVAETWTDIVSGTEKALDAVADATGQPAVPDDLSVSIQALKDQGLLTTEESEKIYGFGSRADVRDELERLATSGRFPVAEVANLDTAVATRYPDFHDQTMNVLQFAELRTYQTLPPPTDEARKSIEEWQNRENKDLPPPPEIRPYIYSLRADELAKTVDLTPFTPEQQSEVVEFLPEAAAENPTAPLPTPKPSPSPQPAADQPLAGTPAPTPQPAADRPLDEAPSPSPVPSPEPTPTPAPPSVTPYITEYKGVLPGDPFYFFKQVGEQVQTATAFDPARRAELHMQHAEERLREATALVGDEARAAVYQQTLERYSDMMHNAADTMKSLGDEHADKKELARDFEVEASRHNIVFEKGLLPVPTENTQIFAEAVQATEDAMDVCADALERAPLPPALTDRLQDLKAQGLVLAEEVDAITQAGTREEVREKIRELVELGTFPPGDAKKMDESQAVFAPQDYNQLVEVRKVEELNRLREVQTKFAQTATLRATKAGYETQLQTLTQTVDTSIIRPEDLAGREDLVRVYEAIAATASARPLNGGQFGPEATPGATPAPPVISPADVVLNECPIGALFQSEVGCVWEDNGRRVDDFEQYRCEKPGLYWSFGAKACVAVTANAPSEDFRPACPAGITWVWSSAACQIPSVGDPFPVPPPEPTPSSDKEREKRAKACPSGSTYQPPRGCVWSDTDNPVYDPDQYRCTKGTYYSFGQKDCVPNPEPGSPLPDDARPTCTEDGTIFRWELGKCAPEPKPYVPTGVSFLSVPQPTIVIPDNPFYFL
ncbi:MAG: DUF5667 domain-containing protein, partial [bacterium]|nr:DUF5667 domain-containing protein [bacterium]